MFMYRAYLAQKKFGVVRDEVGPGSSAYLQPLRKLCGYLQVGVAVIYLDFLLFAAYLLLLMIFGKGAFVPKL